MIWTRFKESGKVTRRLSEAFVLDCGGDSPSENADTLSGVTLGGYMGFCGPVWVW